MKVLFTQNLKQVKRTPSDKYGDNSGDPVHFWSQQSSEMPITRAARLRIEE
jgi:hypothetical protein